MRTLFLLALLCTTLACSARHLPESDTKPLHETVDSIVVYKEFRIMQVYHRQRLLKQYHICLGFQPVGRKHFRDDGKTPEGVYRINGKNPNSAYHKNLGVSYPSADDIAYARQHNKPTGGDIKIHGLPNGYSDKIDDYISEDWTWGCIALTNDEIDELYKYVAVGTCINILP